MATERSPTLKEAVTGKAEPGANPVVVLSRFLDKFKPQMALALPKHLNADRMCRLALTSFSKNPKLQNCTANSIAASIMTASIMGLEIEVDGQGFLVPYKTTCTFIPGWKGLCDLVNRSGRATVWTGAVFEGDYFEWELGANPRCVHRPGAEDDPNKLIFAYAIGRVNGAEVPVIEVWTKAKIVKHRNKYNKVGDQHYSHRDFEMYARKIPLLQVIKYMPKSIELQNALTVANAAEQGKSATYDADFMTVNVEGDDNLESGDSGGGSSEATNGGSATSPSGQQQEQEPAGAGSATVTKDAAAPNADKPGAAAGTKPTRQAAMATHVVSYSQVSNKLKAAREEGNLDALHLAADLIKDVPDATTHSELKATYDSYRSEMEGEK